MTKRQLRRLLKKLQQQRDKTAQLVTDIQYENRTNRPPEGKPFPSDHLVSHVARCDQYIAEINDMLAGRRPLAPIDLQF